MYGRASLVTAIVILSMVGAVTAVSIYIFGKGDNDTVIIGVIIAFLGPTIGALLALEKGFQENSAKIDALHVKTDDTNAMVTDVQNKAAIVAHTTEHTSQAVRSIQSTIDGELEDRVQKILDKKDKSQ
jgi:uncharacterized membrane protein YqgA involved in biofilm formation